MKCCICDEEIEVVGDWDQGHNPYPVSDKGRCCGACNDTAVIPARLAAVRTLAPAADEPTKQPIPLSSLIGHIRSLLPDATFGEDEGGQLVIYTDMEIDADNYLQPLGELE